MLGEGDAGEALPPDVLDDVGEGDQAGAALHDVHPVAGPRIDVDAGTAAKGDVDAVEGVVSERKEDESPLQHAD